MDQADMDFIGNLFRSLETEMGKGFGQSGKETAQGFERVEARLDRMEARLNKIASGAHYVTRLVEWSEKQDTFQADMLRRVNELSDRVSRLENPPNA